MKKSIISVFALAILFSSCQNEQVKQDEKTFDWLDEVTYASSQVFNPNEEYDDDDFMVNNEFAEWILNEAINNPNVIILDPGSREVISREDALNFIHTVGLVYAEDPANPGNYLETMDTIKVQASDIIEILSSEEWNLNKKDFSFRKNVNMLGPVVKTYDEEGNERGKRILFWLKMK
jgi:hypothetical protein